MGKRSREKRLFLAIELPGEVKNELMYFQDQWYVFPGRWTPREKMHITLAFLGSVAEVDIPVLTDALELIIRRHKQFTLTIVSTGFERDFNSGGKQPRMVWAKVGESSELQALYHNVRTTLRGLPFNVHVQRREFTPHITLCRFNFMHLRQWEGEEPPPLEEELNLIFTAEKVSLIESRRRRGGAEYFMVQSFMLSE